MAALYTVSAGQTAEPLDINQLVNVLQEPSGGTESGSFFVAGPITGNGYVISSYLQLRSRVSSPISISTTVTSNSGGAAASITPNHLDSNGFQLYTLNTTATSGNGNVGGTYVVQF